MDPQHSLSSLGVTEKKSDLDNHLAQCIFFKDSEGEQRCSSSKLDAQNCASLSGKSCGNAADEDFCSQDSSLSGRTFASSPVDSEEMDSPSLFSKEDFFHFSPNEDKVHRRRQSLIFDMISQAKGLLKCDSSKRVLFYLPPGSIFVHKTVGIDGYLDNSMNIEEICNNIGLYKLVNGLFDNDANYADLILVEGSRVPGYQPLCLYGPKVTKYALEKGTDGVEDGWLFPGHVPPRECWGIMLFALDHILKTHPESKVFVSVFVLNGKDVFDVMVPEALIDYKDAVLNPEYRTRGSLGKQLMHLARIALSNALESEAVEAAASARPGEYTQLEISTFGNASHIFNTIRAAERVCNEYSVKSNVGKRTYQIVVNFSVVDSAGSTGESCDAESDTLTRGVQGTSSDTLSEGDRASRSSLTPLFRLEFDGIAAKVHERVSISDLIFNTVTSPAKLKKRKGSVCVRRLRFAHLCGMRIDDSFVHVDSGSPTAALHAHHTNPSSIIDDAAEGELVQKDKLTHVPSLAGLFSILELLRELKNWEEECREVAAEARHFTKEAGPALAGAAIGGGVRHRPAATKVERWAAYFNAEFLRLSRKYALTKLLFGGIESPSMVRALFIAHGNLSNAPGLMQLFAQIRKSPLCIALTGPDGKSKNQLDPSLARLLQRRQSEFESLNKSVAPLVRTLHVVTDAGATAQQQLSKVTQMCITVSKLNAAAASGSSHLGSIAISTTKTEKVDRSGSSIATPIRSRTALREEYNHNKKRENVCAAQRQLKDLRDAAAALRSQCSHFNKKIVKLEEQQNELTKSIIAANQSLKGDIYVLEKNARSKINELIKTFHNSQTKTTVQHLENSISECGPERESVPTPAQLAPASPYIRDICERIEEEIESLKQEDKEDSQAMSIFTEMAEEYEQRLQKEVDLLDTYMHGAQF